MISDYHKDAREVTLVLTTEEFRAIRTYLNTETIFCTSFIQEAEKYIKCKDGRAIMERLDEIRDEIYNK